MPDQSHVGRRYRAEGQVVDGERARQFAAAVGGQDGPAGTSAIPPTFAAVYMLAPTMARVFADAELNINLAGLIHGEQSFTWSMPVHAGDELDCTAEIAAVEDRRGMQFVTLDLAAVRHGDGATVCQGRSLMIIRGVA